MPKLAYTTMRKLRGTGMNTNPLFIAHRHRCHKILGTPMKMGTPGPHFPEELGIEPHLMTFDADEMRRHLEQCFEEPAQKCREKHTFIYVYCTFGLPESYDTQSDSDD